MDLGSMVKAAEILKSGGLVVFPTETVFGLGANALDPRAVTKIFEAKGRPQDNPLIVHVPGIHGISWAAQEPLPEELLLFKTFSPGPLTLILRRSKALAPQVSAGLETVGIRIPRHPVARDLLEKAGVPVAAPSANRSGRPSPTDYAMACAEMEGRVDYIVPGAPSEVGLESTIAWLDNGLVHVLRPGSISGASLVRVLREAGFAYELGGSRDTTGKLPVAPGTRYRHYCPNAMVYLWDPGLMQGPQGSPSDGPKAISLLIPQNYQGQAMEQAKNQGARVVHAPVITSIEDFAHNLYRHLRGADEAKAQEVWLWLAPCVEPGHPQEGLTEALRDRSRRASGL